MVSANSFQRPQSYSGFYLTNLYPNTSSDPAIPHCFTITNILAKQHIFYCNNVPGLVTTSYSNLITSGSHATLPPSTITSTTPSTSNAVTTTGAISSISSTTQFVRPSGLSAGAIAGIAVGAFFAGFLVISIAMIFVFLPLIRKHWKSIKKHPRGTLGGAIVPDAWNANDKDSDPNKSVEHDKLIGSGRPSSQLRPHNQSRKTYGGRELGLADASLEDQHSAWDLQSHNRIKRISELADTSLVRPSPELEDTQASNSPTLRKHRSTLRGSPYMWQSTTELASSQTGAVEIMDGHAQFASRNELDLTQRSRTGPYSSSDSKISARAPQIGFGEGSVSNQHDLGRESSPDPKLRPETGFVSNFTSSPPMSAGFEPSPPTIQCAFPANVQPLSQRPPPSSRVDSAPTTQASSFIQEFAPHHQISSETPTILISTVEDSPACAIHSQDMQKTLESSDTQPPKQSVRYLYENRPPTPHAFPPFPTVAGVSVTHTHPSAVVDSNGRGSLRQRLTSSSSIPDLSTDASPSSLETPLAAGAQTEHGTSVEKTTEPMQRGIGEDLSANEPWK